MFWAGIEIGAGIEENEEVSLGGHNGGDARAIDSRKSSQSNGGSGNHGSGVSRGNGCIGQTITNGLDGAKDGVIPFATKRFYGGIPHFDDIFTVADFETRGRLGVAEFLKFLADTIFLAKKEQFFDLGIVREGLEGSGNGTFGSVVSSHRIERNLHQKTREITG